MVLIDTSVWINLLRDQTGSVVNDVKSIVGEEDIALTRFNQIELLQGASNETEWRLLSSYLDGQDYLEADADTWLKAGRIYYELRRRGRTIRSSIDCCIAQIAIDHRVLLIHEDRDFETIAEIRPLLQYRT